MKKIYFLSALVIITIVAMIPQRANAQIPVWDGSYASWTQGSGTQSDPFLIEIPQHLAWLARQVNNGNSTYNGVYFRLTSDLDLNSLEWSPIGNSTANRFKGVFDGDEHFIDNIYISIENQYCGLFGTIENATIMNLVVNSTISYNSTTYDEYTGGIVAYCSGSSNAITSCYHSGSLTINGLYSGYRGGIIGYVNGEITLTDCHNNGLIKDIAYNCNQNLFCSCDSHLGGLIGGVNASVTIADCSNNGAVNGKFGNSPDYHYSSCSGGLVGQIGNGITTIIINSYNNGNITGKYSGGLVGISDEMSQLSISNSHNTGTISGRFQGGLVGSSNTCTITNSYNTGSLSNGDKQGGLIGSALGSISLSHCYNTGIITANNQSWLYSGDNRPCGGIVGNCYGTATISYCANHGSVVVPNLSPLANYSTNAYAYCGGILGYANSTVILDRCYNTASISGLGTNANGHIVYGHVGGLAGHLTASANNIHECYNTGNVASKSQCGGIVGYAEGVTSITNCYNTGLLSGINNNVSSILYGTATITNCYYLNTCGGSEQTGAEAKTSAQMQSPYFPGMLNVGVQAYVQDISPYVNQGYPIFGDLVYAVSTQAATNIGVTKAMLHGYYAGGADAVGFQYRENTANSEWNTVYANIGSPVAYWLTGLESNTSYVFWFMLQKNGEVYYGDEMNFTTNTCNLTASITPLSVEMCQGVATPLTASGQSNLGNYFIYSWNTGSTVATLNVYNGGTYTVNVSDTNGCSATASVDVIAHPLPAVNISGDTYLCVEESNLLTASGGNTYAWNIGTTTSSISVNHGGTYSVTATNTYGCSNSTSVTVVSLENLSISGNTHICSGQSTTLSVVNGTGNYAWSTGANTSFVTVTDPGTYTVTVTLPNGCSSSASAVVTTASLPTPTIVGSTSICQGQSTTLTATGGNTYLWSNGNTTNYINVSQSGVYTVTATNTEGCSAATNVTVTVNPLPTVSISGANSFCQGQSTTLTANGGSIYNWSSGDFTPSVTVSQGGVYAVTATDAAGCSATAEITVTEKPLPNVSISGSGNICQGDATTLTASGASMYLWSNSSTTESIAVSSSGNYTVWGTDANGCSNTATMTVAVNPTYIMSIAQSICQGEVYNFNGINLSEAGVYTQTLQTVNGCDSIVTLTLMVKVSPSISVTGNTTLCESQATTLTANGGNTYVWSNGSTNANVTISQSGIYTVTATNMEGCSSTANVVVTVSPLPTVTISGDNSFCQGGNLTLIANGASSYMWSNGSNTAAITITNPGAYAVIGTDANGCSSSASKTVSVNPSYQIQLAQSICQGSSYNFNGQYLTTAGTYTQTFSTVNGCDSIVILTLTVIGFPAPTISGNTVICEGQTTTLTANGGISYVWSNGSTNASVTISQSGVYTVTATSAEGCSSTANVTVSTSPLPTVSISGNTTFCEGGSTTLIASGADTYSWSTGDNTAAVIISSFGIYTVTGISAFGCSNTASVTVLSLPSPQITITGETDICAGQSTTLTANGGTTYLWSNGSMSSAITVASSGTWQVIGYNDEGCSNTATATVNVWQPTYSEFTITINEPCYTWNSQTYCTSGDYTQTLQTVHGCDSIVTLHLTITVGIDDHETADFKVFPNPTNSVVNVECTMNNVQLGEAEIQVVDMYGKLVRIVETHGRASLQGTIDISDLANGVYFVKLVAEGKTIAVRKVVKQ